MDKETGKEVLIDGRPVTAETTFKPEKSSGTVDVTFTFDATELKGHDVVVFEKLFVTVKEGDKEQEIEVTSHEDLQAESQTVKLTEVPAEPKTPDVSSPVKPGMTLRSCFISVSPQAHCFLSWSADSFTIGDVKIKSNPII